MHHYQRSNRHNSKPAANLLPINSENETNFDNIVRNSQNKDLLESYIAVSANFDSNIMPNDKESYMKSLNVDNFQRENSFDMKGGLQITRFDSLAAMEENKDIGEKSKKGVTKIPSHGKYVFSFLLIWSMKSRNVLWKRGHLHFLF